MKKLALFLSFLFVISCTKDPIIYTLTTSANPYDGGTVSPTTKQYEEGETATINATPAAEYLFQSWSGATGSSSSTSLVMSSDKSVTANFVKKKYALTVEIEGEGTVDEKVIKAGAATDYNSGTVVELTANPSAEWLFVEWTGDLTGSENPKQITIDKAKSVTAVFVKKQYPLTMEIEGEGTVSEKVIKAGAATDYNSGTIVELTAAATEDWEFVEWTGDITSTDNPVQITIDEDKTVKAKFIRYFNYNVPSHDWENYYQPNIDYYNIVFQSLGDIYSLTHSNTYYGIADFNNDGYVDINTGIPKNDNVPIDYFFLVNDGNGTYNLDESLSYTQGNNVLSPRKTIVGDFNGDGKPDVFRPAGAHDNLSKPNLVLSNQNTYEHIVIDSAPLSQPHTVCSGDIDNDGDLDIFVSQAGENDGFLINNGDATFEWKWISEIIRDFDTGHKYPDGGYGYYGLWSSEMTDVDKDGFVDLILGGSYKDQPYDGMLDGPTILWGTGSGFFSINNSTILFNWKDLDYDGQRLISLSHDYAVNDVNGDGINDIVVLSELSGPFLIHFLLGKGERKYEDKTLDWVPNPIIPEETKTVVWIKLMDIDNNGRLDIVEGEPNIYTHQGEMRSSVRWEWNGNGFTKIN
jgi:hypothetical protein